MARVGAGGGRTGDEVAIFVAATRYRGRVKRFLTLAEVSEVLNISAAQAYALVRNGELHAVKIGGRGQWRVEEAKLEEYIQRLYTDTAEFIHTHPFSGAVDDS